jgi:uncharacterized membrane protein YedE/YeeE
MLEILKNPWPWYISGPLISLTMVILMVLGGHFGISSTLRSICSILGAGRVAEFFRFDWKAQGWNLVFVLGAIFGGFLASHFLTANTAFTIHRDTIEALKALGISFQNEYLPTDIFNWASLASPKGILIMVLGGFMVGFGTRWAGGCTSGHAISGLSNLQIPSLIAVIGFFIGGLIMTHFIFPFIFSS